MTILTTDIPHGARGWRNSTDIMRWCRENELITELDQRRWLEHIDNNPTIRMFGIEANNGNHGLVGVSGLTSIDLIHRYAEFSLYIAPEYQSQGYGKPALIELLKYGFYNLGLNRIFGEVFVSNPAMDMFLSVGFIKEGLCRQSYFKGGKFIDSEIISILRSEYDDIYGEKVSSDKIGSSDHQGSNSSTSTIHDDIAAS